MQTSLSPIATSFTEVIRNDGYSAVRDFRIADSLQDLSSLETRWNDLATHHRTGPFQSFAWNQAWYKHFQDEYDEMLVFSFRQDYDISCIVPLYRKGKSLRFAGDTIGDHQDFIARNRASAEFALRKLLDWAKKEGLHFQLDQVREQGWAYQGLQDVSFSADHCLHFQRCYSTCPFLDLPNSLEDYLKSLPRKLRGDLKRHLNRMDREFPDASVEVLRAGEISREFIDEVSKFHRKHFRKDEISLFANPEFVSLLLDASRSPESGLRISTLRNGRELMAMDVGFTHEGIYHGYLTTFDQQYRHVSPGNVLLLKRIDWFVQRDHVTKIDFLLGDERYKSSFTDHKYQVCSFSIYPANLTNFLRWSGKRAYFWGKSLAKRLLKRGGLCHCKE